MRLSIILASSAFAAITLMAVLLGLSWVWALLIGFLAACAGFSIGMKLFVDRQHHGHSKNRVLRNARVQVDTLQKLTLPDFQKSLADLRYDQGLAKTGQPDSPPPAFNGPGAELEDTRVIGDDDILGPDSETPSGILYDTDYPPNSRFFVTELSIEPTEKDTGPHTSYEPDALELVVLQTHQKTCPAPQDPPVSIVGIEAHNGARFLPAEEKLTGPQRLRIHFVVTDPRATMLRLSYYFEQFGEIPLGK